jgi:hypothetical protein
VNGVSVIQLVVDQTGYLQDFFREYASREGRANVLCFADVEGLYGVMYDQGQSFMVQFPKRDLVFHMRNKLYISDFAVLGNALVTRAYTKADESQARQAYELLKMSGYPSFQEAIRPIQVVHWITGKTTQQKYCTLTL